MKVNWFIKLACCCISSVGWSGSFCTCDCLGISYWFIIFVMATGAARSNINSWLATSINQWYFGNMAGKMSSLLNVLPHGHFDHRNAKWNGDPFEEIYCWTLYVKSRFSGTIAHVETGLVGLQLALVDFHFSVFGVLCIKTFFWFLSKLASCSWPFCLGASRLPVDRACKFFRFWWKVSAPLNTFAFTYRAFLTTWAKSLLCNRVKRLQYTQSCWYYYYLGQFLLLLIKYLLN